MYRHELFGLQIASEIPLRSNPMFSSVNPDVLIQRKGIQNPTFTIPTVGQFEIPDEEHIFFDGPHEDSIKPFILGSALGILLQKRGYLVLHGNAIVRDNRCTVFIGPSGAGKSTLTGLFMKAGYQILTDDVCAIRLSPRPEVIPSYPQIKLWRDSAELLGYDTQHLMPLFQRENKFQVDLGEQFCATPMGIERICVLSDCHPRLHNPIQQLSALIQNTYRLQFIETPEERARHLEQCHTLLKHIPVQSLSRPPLPADENCFNHWVSNSLC